LILKPMDVGDILDNTFKLFKDNFKTYIGVSALGMIPVVTVGVLAALVMLVFGETETAAIAIGIIVIIALIPLIAVYLAMEGALIKVSSEQIMERGIGIKEAYRFGFSRAWPLFVTALLMGLAVLGGVILLIIPGIILAIWFTFFRQVTVLENIGYAKALSRSKALVKGNWWRTLGITLLVSLLVGILSNLVSLPAGIGFPLLFGETAGMILSYVVQMALSLLLLPLSYIPLTLFYYDLRVRKEGLDLQIMADNLAESGEGNLITE